MRLIYKTPAYEILEGNYKGHPAKFRKDKDTGKLTINARDKQRIDEITNRIVTPRPPVIDKRVFSVN